MWGNADMATIFISFSGPKEQRSTGLSVLHFVRYCFRKGMGRPKPFGSEDIHHKIQFMIFAGFTLRGPTVVLSKGPGVFTLFASQCMRVILVDKL